MTAIASTVKRPLVEPRSGDGKFFGLAPFGVSSSAPPRTPSERIDFSFQEARLEIKGSQIVLPYPVPFKLLGDEAKGWIDNTFVSETLRIARGNKGTTFVLKKADPSTDPLALLASQSVASLQQGTSPSVSATASAPATPTPAAPAKATASTQKTVTKVPLAKKTTTTAKIATTNSKSRGSNRNINRVAIIFPAQLGTEDDYQELSMSLFEKLNLPAYTAPLSRLDWPIGLVPSFFSREYLEGTLTPKTLSFYFTKVDEAVSKALLENPNSELVLVAHSIGGNLATTFFLLLTILY